MVLSHSEASLLALELLAGGGGVAPGAVSASRPAGASIVGLVVFATPRGGQAEAILDSTGRWHCARLPVLDRVLNGLFAPEPAPPGGLPSGHAELARVAAWLHGEVRSLRFPDLAP